MIFHSKIKVCLKNYSFIKNIINSNDCFLWIKVSFYKIFFYSENKLFHNFNFIRDLFDLHIKAVLLKKKKKKFYLKIYILQGVFVSSIAGLLDIKINVSFCHNIFLRQKDTIHYKIFPWSKNKLYDKSLF